MSIPRRSLMGAWFVRNFTRLGIWVGVKVAGEITYPMAGLAEVLDTLDNELLSEMWGETDEFKAWVNDWYAGEAEAYYEDMEWRAGLGR